MKIPLLLISLFAVLTLCLPLAAVGADILIPERPSAEETAASAAPEQSSAQQPPAASASEASTALAPTEPPEASTPAPEPPQAGAPAAAVETPDSFRILDTATGKVKEVSRVDYVRGAVCSEMPPDFHSQALIAQAVAANTYAVRCHEEQTKNPDPTLKGADFSANPGNWEGYVTEAQAKERYGDNFGLYWDKITKAADEGSDYVLVYGGQPIVAAYHSISSGQTEAAGNVWVGEAPYLAPVESFGDILAPNYESSVQFTAQQVADTLRTENSAVQLGADKAAWLKVTGRSESGYVLTLTAGGQTFAGKDVRRIFGLRSSNFDVSASGDTFTFQVRGYGHGVGLSQYGADYMARQGASFDQILTHYYTGCELRMARPRAA